MACSGLIYRAMGKLPTIRGKFCWAFIKDKVFLSTFSLCSLLYHVWWAGWPTGDRHVHPP